LTFDFGAQYMAFCGNNKAFLEKISIFPEKMPFGMKKTALKVADFRFLPYICSVLLRNFKSY